MQEKTTLLTTEQSNQATENLDMMTAEQIVAVINDEDHKVATAVKEVLPALAQAVDVLANRWQKGGRLFIFGAGTSGRLGVMNAVGVTEKHHLPAGQINGIIAGGDRALRFSVENSEDNREQAIADLMAFHPTPDDVVMGISAGGGAPYILQVMKTAREMGLYTIGYSSNKEAKLKPFSDTFINPVVGPEVLTGSSRMKSGSAQEMTLVALLEGAVAKEGQSLQTIISGFEKAAPAAQACMPDITRAVELIADGFNAGGRLFYFGKGTAGRLGILDASECWPTFGVEHGVVNGYAEGGDAALRTLFDLSHEQSEKAAKDDFVQPKTLPNGTVVAGENPNDVVVALGTDPYALTALQEAKKRGLKTVLFVAGPDKVPATVADVTIHPVVDEVVAPVATKFVLNTLTTASMALTGKVIGNKMVDVAVMNAKLVDRATRIIADFTAVPYEKAEQLLTAAQTFRKEQGQDPNRHVVPVAIVMGKTGLCAKDAESLLKQNKGLVRRALECHQAACIKRSLNTNQPSF